MARVHGLDLAIRSTHAAPSGVVGDFAAFEEIEVDHAGMLGEVPIIESEWGQVSDGVLWGSFEELDPKAERVVGAWSLDDVDERYRLHYIRPYFEGQAGLWVVTGLVAQRGDPRLGVERETVWTDTGRCWGLIPRSGVEQATQVAREAVRTELVRYWEFFTGESYPASPAAPRVVPAVGEDDLLILRVLTKASVGLGLKALLARLSTDHSWKMAGRTLQERLARLRKAGLVELNRKRYFISDQGRDLIDRVEA